MDESAIWGGGGGGGNEQHRKIARGEAECYFRVQLFTKLALSSM